MSEHFTALSVGLPAGAGVSHHAAGDFAQEPSAASKVQIYTVKEKVTIKERVVVKEPAQEESLTSVLLDFSLADAKEQLKLIETQIKDRLYTEYLSQCADVAPYLEKRGRSVGNKLLAALVQAQDPPAYGEVSDEEDSSGSEGEQLAGIDPFLKPVLDPFVAGLTEPFQEQYAKLQTNVVLAFAASSAACLIGGFFLGRHFGGGKKS